MTRRLRGYCQRCGHDVSTRWIGDVRVAAPHRATVRSWTPCKGTGQAARMEPLR